METINAIEALTPYLDGCSFYAEKDSFRYYCLCMTKRVNPFFGKDEIFLHKDFFTCIGHIDDRWTASVDGNTIILHNPDMPIVCDIKIELVDPETKTIPTVEWKPELKDLNFVNEELWERELVREIAGMTYYPLNLFCFKERVKVRYCPQFTSLAKYLHVQRARYTKTLYYYIKDNRLYIGLWNYNRRMPENPLRLCEIE